MEVYHHVASSVLNAVDSLVGSGIASLYGVEREIARLKGSVERIRDVLVDVDVDVDRQKLVPTEDTRLWRTNLKEALFKADDLLDEFHTQYLLRKRDSKGKVRDFFSSSNPIVFRGKIARIRSIIRRQFDSAAETLSRLNIIPIENFEMEHEKSRRKTNSFVRQEHIVGREGNKKDIIDLLLNHNDDDGGNQDVSSVAIVGIGGLGKTALAQMVYNDADVASFFDKRIWVCVSVEPDGKTLVKKMLESLIGTDVKDQDLEWLLNKLRENLNGQRYLLVLDDVWNKDEEKWLDLKKYLMCGAKGSRTLVTTRSPTVANEMGVKTPYFLKGLENDQSWALLKREAFLEDQIVTQNLEVVGKEFVKKCAGVPLAIRALGDLMYLRLRGPRSDDWDATDAGILLMSTLRLSYDILPMELKQCFVYFSLYPKGWKYKKDELIDLWMAQGFLIDKNENQCPEDVGEEYVHVLLMNLFLQDVETGEFGEIKYFKLHNLMHDLSLSIAKANFYPLGSRSFIEVNKNCQRNPYDLFEFQHLRALDFSSHKMRDLPTTTGKMIYLRYLNLSCCYELSSLPYGISNLVNLQTLILSGCHNLKLPGDVITKLISLRRLDIEGCKAFEDGMPVGLGKITSLQWLSHFTVDKGREKAQLNELKELNLRGGLTIQCLGSVMDVEEESKYVNLRTKENLNSLTLKWGPYSDMQNNNPKELLDNLCPHEKLKSLTIEEYPGELLSDWLSLCKNLVRLRFFDIRNCLHLTALEGLDSLKTLHIERMDKLEYIYCSSSTNFFTSLEELRIRRCESLIGWQREGNAQNTGDDERDQPLPPFPRLSSLQVNRCPKLSCMPTFQDLVGRLELAYSSTKPLLDTLNATTAGPSTSSHVPASLSKLKSLHIEGIDIESLPEDWMHNLSSLQHLSIASFPSPEKPFRHMRNLSATLERFTIRYIPSWHGHEDYNKHSQDLCCLHSLQRIQFTSCHHLINLPQWICDLQSLQFISIQFCEKLETFPKEMYRLTKLQTLQLDGAPLLKERCKRDTGAEWTKISRIPNVQIDLDQICPSLRTSEAQHFSQEEMALQSMLCQLSL